MKRRVIHPAWIVAGITFATLFATAGFRSAPSVLILPLEKDFGWQRDVISLAVAINVLLYGLTAPFAAALMERFTVRKVVMSALSAVSIGAFLTIFMTAPWHLMLLWGVVVGVGSLGCVDHTGSRVQTGDESASRNNTDASGRGVVADRAGARAAGYRKLAGRVAGREGQALVARNNNACLSGLGNGDRGARGCHVVVGVGCLGCGDRAGSRRQDCDYSGGCIHRTDRRGGRCVGNRTGARAA